MGIQDVIKGHFLSMELSRGADGGFILVGFPVKGRFLMRVLPVSEILDFLHSDREDRGKRGGFLPSISLFQIPRNGGVIMGG